MTDKVTHPIFDAEVNLVEHSPEPTLREILRSYYLPHFPVHQADELVSRYIASHPTNTELVEAARAVIDHMSASAVKGQAPGHCHDVPGIWDADNGPELAGKPCEWCALWERFKTLSLYGDER